MQEILIVGFGAVGAIFSYSLHLSGKVRLTVVARGNYDLVHNEGMNIKSERYGNIQGWKPDRVLKSVSDAADTQYSHVILATKCIPDVVKTPEILKPLLSPPYCDQFRQPTYVLLQNGMNIEVDLYHAIKALGQDEPKIVNTGVYVFANLSAPNVVEHGPFARLDVGVYRPNDFTTMVNSPEEQALLDELKGLFHNANILIFPEIQRVKFAKNMLNVAFAGFSCLTRFSVAAVYRPPPTNTDKSYEPYLEPATAEHVEQYTRTWIADILKELVDLGRALGFPDSEDGLPSSIIEKSLTSTEKNYSNPNTKHVPSALLDIENGYPFEVEVIWGEVVRMAKERNVDIPRIEMSYALLVLVQNQILRQRNSRL